MTLFPGVVVYTIISYTYKVLYKHIMFVLVVCHTLPSGLYKYASHSNTDSNNFPFEVIGSISLLYDVLFLVTLTL